MKKRVKIFLKIVMVVMLIVASLMTGVKPIKALELVDMSDYPTQETVTYNGKAIYGEDIVGDFTIGGKLAFCMQHSLSTPSTGTRLSSKVYKDANIQKVLYYGYDGVEPWSGFKNRQHGIVVTSLALSYFYDGDNSAPSTIKDFVNYIQKQTVPNYGVNFSKSKVSAYREGNIQRTESLTLQSERDQFGMTVNLQEQVTYVNEDNGARQTGGSVSIKGQTTFHLEAPLQVKLEQWTTGQQVSSYAYQPIISEPSSSSLQTIGRGYYIVDRTKTTSLTVDWLQLSNLELSKTDVDGNLINGAVFRLWNNQGYDQNITITNGRLKVENILLGEYFLQEKSAPHGYLLDDTVYTLTLNAGDTVQKVISNKEPRGKIVLQKTIQSDITNHLIGNAYLSDNEYGLYAKADIKSASGAKTYYVKDQLISKKKTNVEGMITWEDLPIGSYYVKELTTNPSLIIDSTTYDAILTYQNMNTSLVVKQVNVSDKIASQRIQIFKEGTKDGVSGVVQGLQGAEFTFVLKSDYEKVGFDKAKKYYVGTTDQNGFLTTPLLPYGTYRVKETKTPQGYYGTNDFLITIQKDHSLHEIGYQIKKVTVNNLPFESLIKIVKLDQETGKVIAKAGATFKIKNLDKDEYVSYIDWSAFPHIHVSEWTTHDDGMITLNTKLKIGHYQLEEIKAPDGYVLNKEPLKFEITEQSYEIASDQVTPITTVKFSDRPVKGKIIFDKQGEVLIDYQKGQFIYELSGLSDVQFEIRAREDIKDPAQMNDILYKKGDIVEVVKTNNSGKAISSQLPLGKYEYQEVNTQTGFVLDNEIKKFDLEYQDQTIELVEKHISVKNERQKVLIEVGKKDEETLQYLEGAQIALIANRDIYNVHQELIVKAGTVIETVISLQRGKVSFQSDLPVDRLPGKSTLVIETGVETIGNIDSLFMIKEIKPPVGYASKNIQYYIDTQSHHQTDQKISFEYDFLNKKIPVETLGDQPPVVKTEDTTILLTYLLMGIGAFLIFRILLKNNDE